SCWTRRAHGVGVSETRFARLATLMRAFACSSARILKSIASKRIGHLRAGRPGVVCPLRPVGAFPYFRPRLRAESTHRHAFPDGDWPITLGDTRYSKAHRLREARMDERARRFKARLERDVLRHP